MENFSDVGKYLRIPCQKISYKNKQHIHIAIINAIAEKLKVNQRNYLPIIVEEIDDEEYEVLLNAHVLEAAKKADIDFVWCIIADDERRKQIEIESKQRFEINLLTASEKTLTEIFDYIKTVHSEFSQVNPKEVARKIVKNRSNKWKNYHPLTKSITKLKCKIGVKKLPVLNNYFLSTAS